MSLLAQPAKVGYAQLPPVYRVVPPPTAMLVTRNVDAVYALRRIGKPLAAICARKPLAGPEAGGVYGKAESPAEVVAPPALRNMRRCAWHNVHARWHASCGQTGQRTHRHSRSCCRRQGCRPPKSRQPHARPYQRRLPARPLATSATAHPAMRRRCTQRAQNAWRPRCRAAPALQRA